jgi:4-amino-4-deoxy-L-arabinose transferase-like glycosyltransferase
MSESTPPAQPHREQQRVSARAARVEVLVCYALLFMLAIACIAGAARIVFWSATEQVSFDGAMNLEVARSLAEGHGYERLYADRSGFSHEIQSRAPYIVPAAAVFAAFGVGVWQSQLTNLLYVAALVAVIFLLVLRWTSWRWGLLAVGVCLWTPGIREIAMNGYGEVPALAWWLAAVLVLGGSEAKPSGYAHLLVGGVLLGMALLTKTVLAIGLVAILPVVIAALASHGSRGKSVLLGIFAFAVGLLLPGSLYEIAHFFAIGDIHKWHAWVRDEMHAIHMQAGTADGFRDTQGIGPKMLIHLRLLADNLGLPFALMPFWLAGPIVLAVIARRSFPAHARAALFALILFAAIYFLWWLGFTPTEKAWYRRVFNGVLVYEVVLVATFAAVWKLRLAGTHSMRRAAMAACVVVAALQALLLGSNVGADDESDFAPAGLLSADLDALQRVSASADMYGVGWYSAPALALYSGRRFGNIATKTPTELAASSPVFLVLDAQAMRTGAGQYWLDRYSNRDIARSASMRLVELDAGKPRNPFDASHVDDAAVAGRVDFHRDDYPYVLGFQNREGDGWRWASADVEVLLRYRGEPEFNVDIYLPSLQGFRQQQDVGITVWIGSCRLGTFRQNESKRERWWLPAGNCPLKAGQLVGVRLTSDNLLVAGDDRQLAYIVHALGFAEPLSADQR